MQTTETTFSRYLRLPEVLSITGLKRATIYAHIAKGQFPRQVKLGERAVGWRDDEVCAWAAALFTNQHAHEAANVDTRKAC